MKINYECYYDVLKKAEENLSVEVGQKEKNGMTFCCFTFKGLSVLQMAKLLPQYSLTDLFYAMLNLYDSNLVIAEMDRRNNRIFNFYITDITYKGHEILAAKRYVEERNKQKT